MSTKPLSMLLNQVRARPEHRVLVEAIAAHGGRVSEALGVRREERRIEAKSDASESSDSGPGLVWKLAMWTGARESGEALRLLQRAETCGCRPLDSASVARRLLALLDAAHCAGRDVPETRAAHASTRAWAATLAWAAYGMGAPRAEVHSASPTRPSPAVDGYVVSPLGDVFEPSHSSSSLAVKSSSSNRAMAQPTKRVAPARGFCVRRRRIPRARHPANVGWKAQTCQRSMPMGVDVSMLGAPRKANRGSAS